MLNVNVKHAKVSLTKNVDSALNTSFPPFLRKGLHCLPLFRELIMTRIVLLSVQLFAFHFFFSLSLSFVFLFQFDAERMEQTFYDLTGFDPENRITLPGTSSSLDSMYINVCFIGPSRVRKE